ncbi:hypothetical protein JJV70_02000 [Streptomyces sp. JJ66]|uniref:hypothetical protein n=1 Tax=Streptomyces sp. JJ66 TaxID=2803843 RepID=UPI001C58C920|nr:hypothetical protein [Streptomyces sp. JJ66]MBW1600893.1 hypothetical protein [Streptomyces sp. JJ66]
MALPDLATESDLEAYLQAPVDAAAATVALQIASAAIRSFTKQVLTFVAQETVLLAGGERTLRLPQRPPVVDGDNPLTVVEVADGGGQDCSAVEDRDYTRLGAELTRSCPWYAPGRYMGWPYSRTQGVWAPRVKVTYSHGYTEIPPDITGVCLDLAAATLTNPSRLRSETVGGVSQVYTVETFGTGSLTASHRDILRSYRRTALSVAPS